MTENIKTYINLLFIFTLITLACWLFIKIIKFMATVYSKPMFKLFNVKIKENDAPKKTLSDIFLALIITALSILVIFPILMLVFWRM